MKSNNTVTRFFILLGIMLAVFAIARLDAENTSFDNNQKAYLMFAGSVISMLYAYLRVKNEKKREGQG